MGGMETDKVVQIRLSGESIADEHCWFDNKDGKVTLHALPGAKTVRSPPNYQCPFRIPRDPGCFWLRVATVADMRMFAL